MRMINRLISAGLITGILFPGLVILIRCLPHGVPLAGPDFLFQFEPWWEFTRESIRSGRLPWWDASVMLGYPHLADPQSALFYPLNWLMLLAPVGPSLALLTGAHLALTGLFTACWMRSRGGCLPAALFSGMAISSSGFLLSHVGAGHYTLICAAAWTPAVLWQLDRFRMTQSHRTLMGAGICWSLQFLAGHLQTSLLTTLAAAIWFGCRGSIRSCGISKRQLAGPALMILLMVGGPFLLALELAHQSILPEPIPQSIVRDALPPQNLTTLIFPNIQGGLSAETYTGSETFHETYNYLGIAVLLFAMTAPVRSNRVLYILLLLGAGLSILPRIPGASALMTSIPALGITRRWARSMFLADIAGVMLAGHGIHAWLTGTLNHRRGRAVCGLMILLAVGIYHSAGWFLIPVASIQRDLLVTITLTLLITGLMLFKNKQPVTDSGMKSILLILLAVIALSDLSFRGWRFLRPANPAYRTSFLRLAGQLHQTIPQSDTRILFYQSPELTNRYFKLGYDTITGYRPWPLDRFRTAMQSANGIANSRFEDFPSFSAPFRLTRLAGIAYWIGPPAPFDGLDARLTGTIGKDLIYTDDAAMPRAWLTPEWETIERAHVLKRLADPDWSPATTALLETSPEWHSASQPADGSPETVQYRRKHDGHCILDVAAARPGILVFTDVWYPGWSASIDARSTPVFHVDHLFQGVAVPAGHYRIEFRYTPGWRWGCVFLPILGLAGSLGWIVRQTWSARHADS